MTFENVLKKKEQIQTSQSLSDEKMENAVILEKDAQTLTMVV